MRWTAWLAAACVAVAGFAVGPAAAQAGPTILVVDPERVLEESDAGRAVFSEIEAERERLAAESDEISRAFEREERALTDARDTTDPDEFTELAADFDRRVRAARAERDRLSEDLARRAEEVRRGFFEDLNGIYVQIMRETGAAAILDLRDVVLVARTFDITDAVIARLDATRQPAPSGRDAGVVDGPRPAD